MKKHFNDGHIVLSNKRLKNLITVLKVDDYIAVSIVRNLGKGRYKIKLQGFELVAAFSGVLPSDSMIYAVVQSVEPHIVLKLVSNDSSIQRRVENVSKVISRTEGRYSLQPLMGEIIISFMRHCEAICGELGDSRAHKRFECTMNTLLTRIKDAAVTFDEEFSIELFSRSVLQEMHAALVDVKQSVIDLCDDPIAVEDFQVQSLLLDLSKECDDLILATILQQTAHAHDTAKRPFDYYQVPVAIDGTFGTAEVYINEHDEMVRFVEIWLHKEDQLIYAKSSISDVNKAAEIITLMYPKESRVFVAEIVAVFEMAFAEKGWKLNTDTFLAGSYKAKNAYPRVPQTINIRTIQHFTLVA